jgi:hypothetical protein
MVRSYGQPCGGGGPIVVSALWLLPLAVAAGAVWPLLALTRRVAAELDALRSSAHALGEVGPALVALADDAARAYLSLENLPLH